MKLKNQCERGNVWIILLVLVAIVVGGWQYSEHQEEKKRLELAAIAQKDLEAKREAERVALEQRLAQEKEQKNALIASNKALDAILARWEDAVNLAGTTGRIALSTPVSTLQTIRREAGDLTVVPCLVPAMEHLQKSMKSTIDGFITFMRNELKIGEELAQIDFRAATGHLSAFKQARQGCSN